MNLSGKNSSDKGVIYNIRQAGKQAGRQAGKKCASLSNLANIS